MGRKLETLAVAGFQIRVGDHSAFWQLIDDVKALSNNNVTERSWDSSDDGGFQDKDLVGKDAIICYSWGVASVFMAIARLKAAGAMPTIPLIIIMAGVPRGVSQCIAVTTQGGWIIPDEIREAICLQVNSFPVSHPIANSSADRVNILITGIPGNDHVGLEDFKTAHDIIINIIGAAAQAEGMTP